MWHLGYLLAIPILYVLYNTVQLLKYYLVARKIGYPIVIVPIAQKTVPWMTFSVPLKPLMVKVLPKSWFERIHPLIYGFEYSCKCDIYDKFGRTFVLVCCGGVEIHTIEPDLAAEVMKRPKEFRQPREVKLLLETFGPNMITSNGEVWARQRRLIAPHLNERISAAVFSEGRRQAGEMLDHVVNVDNGVTNNISDSFKSIAFNVLASAAYGEPRPWKSQETDRQIPTGYRYDFAGASKLLVEYFIFSGFLSVRILNLWFLPKIMNEIGVAKGEWSELLKKKLDNELQTAQLEKGLDGVAPERNNLLSQMARLNNQAIATTEGDNPELERSSKSPTTSAPAQVLKPDEISGNLFLFTIAGFDTTANAMSYALVLLSAYPEWQAWAREEIQSVMTNGVGVEDVAYAETFPKLLRCLALIYETLRLFPPLAHLNKGTFDYSTTVTSPDMEFTPTSPPSTTKGSISSRKRQYVVPPHTSVWVNIRAMAIDESVWGSDALEFRPGRWITKDPKSGVESMLPPPKNQFLPWSGGPRSCPGSKMSQVEFVAVFMTILAKFRVEAVPLQEIERVKRESVTTKNGEKLSGVNPKKASGKKGIVHVETKDEMQKRLWAAMDDCQPRLTVQMNHPEDVWIRFLPW